MSADESDGEIVRLPGSVPIHRRWRRTGGFTEECPYQLTMEVEMDDDGVPRATGVNIALLPNWPGLDMATLAEIKLDKWLEGLMQTEVMVTMLGADPGFVATMSSDEERALFERVARDSETVTKAATRRRPTKELLTKVLELYDAGGVRAVQAETSYSESYCFKLLRRAREELS
jgi:hypothetical protein